MNYTQTFTVSWLGIAAEKARSNYLPGLSSFTLDTIPVNRTGKYDTLATFSKVWTHKYFDSEFGDNYILNY